MTQGTIRLLLAAALLLPVRLAFAGDPAATCEAGKLGTTAKYAQCRLKAHSKAAKLGGSPDYSKCSLAAFATAESKAQGTCPSNADQVPIASFLDSCADSVATALHGGSLPLDASTCNANLTQCQTDLASCTSQPKGQPAKTGQTVCSDFSSSPISCAGSGQDGETQKGRARDFTDNGDGTITDNNTGLTWEKLDDSNLSGLSGIHDVNNQYCWSCGATKIADLNSMTFAGHTDWRIPNVAELLTLVKYGTSAPAIEPEFQSGCSPGCTSTTCSCTTNTYYWTSDNAEFAAGYAWVVEFGYGQSTYASKGGNFWLRAVRGG